MQREEKLLLMMSASLTFQTVHHRNQHKGAAKLRSPLQIAIWRPLPGTRDGTLMAFNDLGPRARHQIEATRTDILCTPIRRHRLCMTLLLTTQGSVHHPRTSDIERDPRKGIRQNTIKHMPVGGGGLALDMMAAHVAMVIPRLATLGLKLRKAWCSGIMRSF